MLPAPSHATSVGPLKTSLCAPAPGAPKRPRPAGAASASAAAPPRPPPAAAPPPRPSPGISSGHALGFRLPAKQHLDLAVRVELDHHARHPIDHPDVVLRIDPH